MGIRLGKRATCLPFFHAGGCWTAMLRGGMSLALWSARCKHSPPNDICFRPRGSCQGVMVSSKDDGVRVQGAALSDSVRVFTATRCYSGFSIFSIFFLLFYFFSLFFSIFPYFGFFFLLLSWKKNEETRERKREMSSLSGITVRNWCHQNNATRQSGHVQIRTSETRQSCPRSESHQTPMNQNQNQTTATLARK